MSDADSAPVRDIDREVAPDEGEKKVKPLELFFDLVFVVAATQVTTMLAQDLTLINMFRGLMVLAALWWAWVGYSWVTNAVDPEEGGVRIAIFAAMAAMLIAALSVPGAFGANATVFAVAYLFVRVGQVALLFISARSRDETYKRAVRLISPWLVLGPTLILVASFLPIEAQTLVWVVALLIDYGGALSGNGEGWEVEPSHFAERHSLIVIIALGEALVAIGVGLEGFVLGAGEIFAAVLGVVIAAMLWWTYFDVVAIMAERHLARADRQQRSRMARDSYSYIHFLMIAGIILLALGIKKTLNHAGDPLDSVPAIALFGGIAVYMIGMVLFRLRNIHTWSVRRTLAAVACVVMIYPATLLPAIVSMIIACLILITVVVYETIRYREVRADARGLPTSTV